MPDKNTCARCKREKPADEFISRGREVVRCAECRRKVNALQVKWRANNRAKVAASNKAYRVEFPERAKAATERWRANNPERVAATSAAYYEANREQKLEKNRKWARENPEKKRAARDPEKSRHYVAKRKALKLERATADVRFTDILLRDAGVCGICEKPIMENTIELDHIIPLAAGGWHGPDNIQLAHRSCNRRKFTRVNFTLRDVA